MANGNKFWLDRFLYEIPLLTCDHEKLDYPAIMSRFHYLLLKKDKKTHEEFMKYWAILIITAPNAFVEGGYIYYSDPVSSEVQASAIKMNRPMEKIELPPGQPEPEKASNFRYENWKPILDETYSRDDMDDLQVYKWYTDPANIKAARSFFGSYCMSLLGIYTKKLSTLVKFVKRIQETFHECIEMTPKPYGTATLVKRISFSLGTATFIRDCFRSDSGTYRKVLRNVLDCNEYLTEHTKERVYHRQKLYESCVKPTLIYYGLSIMDFALTHQVNIENWLKLKSACERVGSGKLLVALNSFDTAAEYIDGLRRQDGTFLEREPQLRGENCKFWPYSRLFSSQYFESLGDENNLEFLAFCLGYKNMDRNTYYGSYNRYLANVKYDKITKEANQLAPFVSTEEAIEQGYDLGRAVYTSQNPPK